MTLTVKDCMQNFFFHCTYEKTLSPKSIKAYRIDLNQFFDFIKREHRETVDVVDKRILRAYIEIISDRTSRKTTKRKVATLKAFFNYLEFEDIIAINPFRKLRIKIKEGKHLPKTIPLRRLRNLFKLVYRERDEMKCDRCYSYKTITRDIAVLELLFSTGARVAELCNLKKENIDFSKASIRITGKGNKERIIPICNIETIDALKTYYKLFEEEISSVKFFFINRLKGRLSEQSVRFMVKKYFMRLKTDENVTPHMFRHSVATLLVESGVDIRYVQTLLGHSSIMTTQIYVQVNAEAQRKILFNKHPRRMLMAK